MKTNTTHYVNKIDEVVSKLIQHTNFTTIHDFCGGVRVGLDAAAFLSQVGFAKDILKDATIVKEKLAQGLETTEHALKQGLIEAANIEQVNGYLESIRFRARLFNHLTTNAIVAEGIDAFHQDVLQRLQLSNVPFVQPGRLAGDDIFGRRMSFLCLEMVEDHGPYKAAAEMFRGIFERCQGDFSEAAPALSSLPPTRSKLLEHMTARLKDTADAADETSAELQLDSIAKQLKHFLRGKSTQPTKPSGWYADAVAVLHNSKIVRQFKNQVVAVLGGEVVGVGATAAEARTHAETTKRVDTTSKEKLTFVLVPDPGEE